MSQTEQILLELFETYPKATTGEIIERTGLARRTVQKYLTLLVDEGKLEALGEYIVPKSLFLILPYLKMTCL